MMEVGTRCEHHAPPQNTSNSCRQIGTQLLAGDEIGSLQMWDVETGTRTSFIRAENQGSISNYINDIAFHPDSQVFATAESDPRGVIRIFTTDELESVTVFISDDYHADTSALSYHPDGNVLVAILDDRIYLLETTNYTVIEHTPISQP